MKDLIPMERVESRIYLIRGQKVMIDRDLAELYGVSTRNLKRQVRRNPDRFPLDFMFILNRKEIDELVCQFGTPFKSSLGGARPFAFTEHGILMLSSVLNSKRAIQVNIRIMRVFNKLKEAMAVHKELALKLDLLEERFGKRLDKHDSEIAVIFDAIRKMLVVERKPKAKIGFIE